MGIIRKTVSISTLGIVPFRSKRELARRAERDRKEATDQLSRLQLTRAAVEERVTAAEKRLQEAEQNARLEAAAAAADKRPSRRARRRAKRRGGKRGAKEVLVDLVAAAQPVAQDQVKAAGRRARARAREAQRAVAPHVEATRDRALSLRDDLVERASAAAADLKDKAEAARSTD